MKKPIIGRDREMKTLLQALNQTSSGRGTAVFISGEAGSGKTHLVDELRAIAETRGFRILSGSAVSGIQAPYMPFIQMLKPAGLEHLFAESSPKVVCAYLMNNAGLVLGKHERENTGLDAEIFASMLTAVNSFVQDSLSLLKRGEATQTMNRLGYGSYTILIESNELIHLAVIIEGRENEFLIEDMREILDSICKSHGDIIKRWRGDISEVRGTADAISRLITCGKYDGTAKNADDPKLRRGIIMENITRGLIRASETSPLLLILDNLQWADTATSALIQYISRSVFESRIMLVCTYRPEEITEPGSAGNLSDIIQAMKREQNTTEVQLGRLDRTSAEMLVRDILHTAGEIPQEIVDIVFKESEGNPLFIIESIQLLVAENIIVKRDGAWEALPDLPGRIPGRIYDIVMRRLMNLPKLHRELLECASVCGNEFSSSHLERLTGLKKIDVLKALRDLQIEYSMIHTTDNFYVFDHGKVRDVIYSNIPPEIRMEYHRMLGELIESENKENAEETTPLLAYHFSRAGERKKAMRYLKIAAEGARRRFANRDAVRLYSELLEFLREPEESNEKALALESRAEARALMGDYSNAIADYRAAIGICTGIGAAGNVLSVPTIRRKLAVASFKKGDYKTANAELNVALKEAGELNDEIEKARVLTDAAWVHGEMRDYTTADAYCRNALSILEKRPELKKDLAQLHRTMAVVAFYRNEFADVMTHSQLALKLYQEIDDKQGVAATYNLMGIAEHEMGNVGKALEWYEKSRDSHEKIGDLFGYAGALSNIGSIYKEKGDVQRAAENFQKSLRIYRKFGDYYSIADMYNNIGEAKVEAGDFLGAVEWHGRNLYMREWLGDADGIARAYVNIADTMKESGDYKNALKYLHRSVEISLRIGNKLYEAYNYVLLSECHLKTKDFALSRFYGMRAAELAEQFHFTQFQCQALRTLGTLNFSVGEYAQASDCFKRAISLFTKKDDTELGKTHHQHALLLFENGDEDAAFNAMQSALAIYAGKSSAVVETLRKEAEMTLNIWTNSRKS